MKNIIVLSLMFLTACGSAGGHNSSSGAVSAVSGFKHALLIVDPMSQNVGAYIAPTGYDVTMKVVDGWADATTVDGTHLDGAAKYVPGWLAEREYDAIIICLGQYEWNHNYSADFTAHGGYPDSESRTFLNAVLAAGNRAPIIYAFLPTSAAYPANNASTYGITTLEARSLTFDQIGVAVNQAIGQF